MVYKSPPETLTQAATAAPARAVRDVAGRGAWRRRLRPLVRYVRRNPSLAVGTAILCALLLFVAFGYLFYDMSRTSPLSVPANRSPSAEFPLGSDRQGRDILALMIAGTPLTLRIGLIAGAVGVGIGMILAFVAAYYGGIVDGTIKLLVDVLLTIPGLLVLVLIAVSLPQGGLTVDQMALVVAILAWLWPTRTIRSQVLVMRERAWVEIARLSGMSGPEVIVREMIPNLLPYVAASFVGAVAAAILASIGLEALGLGPFESPTIGMTIYWNIYYSSILHGLWWWLMPPIILIILVFVSLFLISAGLDEWANPRLRRRV
ncbi:MAG: ABC transporter permease [Chloroflexi bacterium]|nr:ABC transporter permease [Chloroflexota bacterium]